MVIKALTHSLLMKLMVSWLTADLEGFFYFFLILSAYQQKASFTLLCCRALLR